jgi:DNA repair protein RadC
VVAHNHPSGDPEPSAEDREVTCRLVSAGQILGVAVLDHVVIGGHGYVSFARRGWLQAQVGPEHRR